MEKIDIIMWTIGGGFAATLGGFFYIANEIGKLRIEISDQMKDLRRDVQDIDRRLSRMEGMMINKDCCMISDSRKMDKAQ